MSKFTTEIQKDKMRLAGKMAASVLDFITPHVKAGITTNELDKLCHDYIVSELKAIPAPLNYHGFPKSICTSINHVVCHGIPSNEKLKKGDIINIDITVNKDGYFGDTSKMFMIEPVAVYAKKLVNITQTCLYEAIRILRPGVTTGDIGSVIEKIATSEGYSITRNYCGHGIGTKFHDDSLTITHYGRAGTGKVLEDGMCFTIEPMINLGKHENIVLSDGWTVINKDHKLSAQWEHTIMMTADGCEVLTKRDEEDIF